MDSARIRERRLRPPWTTKSVPMLPPAPERFSTTTGCPQGLGELLGDQAHDDVVRPARSERHDDPHGPGRIVLRVRARPEQDRAERHAEADADSSAKLRHSLHASPDPSSEPERRYLERQAPTFPHTTPRDAVRRVLVRIRGRSVCASPSQPDYAHHAAFARLW